jgi:rubrerythrin
MVSLDEVLTTALNFEREGRRVYLDAARRVRDAVIAAVLEALANDEQMHETMIRRYYEAMERHEDWPEADIEAAAQQPAKQRIEEIVQKTAGSIGPDETFISVYEKARDLELQSRDFYRTQADSTDDRELVKFFRFLAGMEQTHLEMLSMLVNATRDRSENEAKKGESR